MTAASLLGKLDLKYYSRDWDKTLPSSTEGLMNKGISTDKPLPSLSKSLINNGMHIVGLALPFIGTLYQPTGRYISYISLGLNSFASVLNDAETSKKARVWNWVKNGVEVVGTFADLKIGVALHTVMNLGEDIFSLRNFMDLSRSQIGEKMLNVVSNSLYLVTLYSFSKKMSYAVTGASLAFKGCISFYKAQKSSSQVTRWVDMKVLDTAAHLALTGIFLYKARTCYHQFMRIHTAVQRICIVMRPASKSSKEGGLGGLTEKGVRLAHEKINPTISKIRQENHLEGLVVFSSPSTHHKETGDIILGNATYKDFAELEAIEDEQERLEELEDALDEIDSVNEDDNLRKPTKVGWELIGDKIVRRADPGYNQYHNLTPEEQWNTAPNPQDPRSESNAQIAARLLKAVQEGLDDTANAELPIFITDGKVMQKGLESIIRSNPGMDPKLAKSIKDGAIAVITTTPDENGDQHFTSVKRIDPRKA